MKKRSVLTMLSIVVVLGCFQSFALAQSDRDIATVSSSGSSVRWDMPTPSQVTLTISSPDGRVFSKAFKSGTTPEFALDQGEKLPDGNYTYELRVNPALSAEAKKALKASRGKDDEAEEVRAGRKRLNTSNLVQSGGFSVINGSAIVAGATEDGDKAEYRPLKKAPAPSPATTVTSAALTKIRQHHVAFSMMPDQVIPDDLIVQGSACVGLDCVNNENFGFDTIRLKENNTRLQFDDTSTTAGFPTNNWQIRANSSASGGGSFLGFVDQGTTGNSETGTIVFQVDAGAPSNSLRVASSGKVGLRTATPVLDVHANTSDTPAIRLEQNNSGGFSAQTWDIGANEANFFVRDVTGGSRLSLRIRPGAPTSSIDISASGFVGFGIASPAQVLHSKVTSGDSIWRMDTANKAAGILKLFDATGDITFQTHTTANALYVKDNGDVGIGTTAPDQKFSVNGNASKTGGTTWLAFSDERLKTIKGPFDTGLKAIMQLQPIRFEYKRENALGLKSEGEQIGFAAQAIQNVIPEAVVKTPGNYLMINSDPILWTMLNAIKEQQKQIEELKAEIQQLKTASPKQ